MTIISPTKIEDFFAEQLSKRSVPDNVALVLISALVEASKLGIDSHGVNLFSHYLDCIDGGRVDPISELDIQRADGLLVCDAKNSFAHYAAHQLLKELDHVSDQLGIAFGTILNSDHIGAVGIHGFNSGIRNKLVLGFTNADALASNPDGNHVTFGTNPISLVFVKNSDEFLYIDLATTKFSMNRVKNYLREGISLPTGVARDANGEITTEPAAASSLEPIGGHKGFALAFAVEILTAGLTGQPISKLITPMYGSELSLKRKISHSFLVIDPSRIGAGSEVSVWNAISLIRESLTPEQMENSPGIKEANIKREREFGIPVLPEVLQTWEQRGFKRDQAD